MANTNQLKYGFEQGAKPTRPILMKGSQEIRAKSGRFIGIDNANGFAFIATAATTRLEGFLEDGDRSIPAGDGIVALTRILPNLVDRYKIPINGGTAFIQSMIGKTCDISVVSDIQGADLIASLTDVLLIVDGDFENSNWAVVQFNPDKLTGYPGVA